MAMNMDPDALTEVTTKLQDALSIIQGGMGAGARERASALLRDAISELQSNDSGMEANEDDMMNESSGPSMSDRMNGALRRLGGR